MFKSFLFLIRPFTKAGYKTRGLGLGRLCEAVRRWVARNASSEPILIEDFRGNGKFFCFLSEHMSSQIFFRGNYSGKQLDLLEKYLPKDGTFIDVGANHGEFTIAAALLTKGFGKVVSFEPSSHYRKRLERNIQVNEFDHVIVSPLALGEEEGSFPMYDSLGDFCDGTKHEGILTLFGNQDRSEAIEQVIVKSFDTIADELEITRIDVMKLDIEGAELLALKGARASIIKHKPVLIVEVAKITCEWAGYTAEHLLEFIQEMGYKIQIIKDLKLVDYTHHDDLSAFQNIIAIPTSPKNIE